MNSNFKNIALFTGSVGVVAGSGYGGYYLSKAKTIEQKLIREGEKLIETDDEYLVAFKENKSSVVFINLIRGDDSSISEKGDVNKGKDALKKWCQNSLKSNLTEENLDKYFSNIQRYCTKPPMTIAERIKKIGKWVSNWISQLEKLKTPKADNTLVADLKLINPQIQDLSKPSDKNAYDALEKWCNDNGSKNLADSATDEIWTKAEKRCLELKP